MARLEESREQRGINLHTLTPVIVNVINMGKIHTVDNEECFEGEYNECVDVCGCPTWWMALC